MALQDTKDGRCRRRFHFFCEVPDLDYSEQRAWCVIEDLLFGDPALSKKVETELVERVIASVMVAVGTRYVVEVERELLMLRIQVLEKGSELGNVELLDDVEARLSRVNERMDGFAGEVLRVMQDVRRELSRLNFGSAVGNVTGEVAGKKRGRPPKTGPTDASRSNVAN